MIGDGCRFGVHDDASSAARAKITRNLLFVVFILLRLCSDNHEAIDCPKYQYNSHHNPEFLRDIAWNRTHQNNKKSADKKDGGHKICEIFKQPCGVHVTASLMLSGA